MLQPNDANLQKFELLCTMLPPPRGCCVTKATPRCVHRIAAKSVDRKMEDDFLMQFILKDPEDGKWKFSVPVNGGTNWVDICLSTYTELFVVKDTNKPYLLLEMKV